jgi:hypothetical protein
MGLSKASNEAGSLRTCNCLEQFNEPEFATPRCRNPLRINITQLLCPVLDVFFDRRVSPVIINFCESG